MMARLQSCSDGNVCWRMFTTKICKKQTIMCILETQNVEEIRRIASGRNCRSNHFERAQFLVPNGGVISTSFDAQNFAHQREIKS